MNTNDEYYVNITQTAFDDLMSIAVYIRDTLKEPVIAINQVTKIKEVIFSLKDFPCRQPLVRNKMLAAQGYRSITVDNYTIFYVVNERDNIVNISRALYSRRNWGDLL